MRAKAIVADDHPLFRSAMKQAVEGILGNNILESSTFDETFNLLENNPDVELVFLDLKMPGNQGLLGLTSIRNAFPDVLVVIVSAEENPALIRKSIDFGSSGYIPKSTPLPVIASAVQQILEGEIWLPADLAEQVPGNVDGTERQFARRLEQLTPHQFTVLKMLADGLLNKQIAYELNVSESTIKQHVSAVLHKLGFNNRTQAGVLFKQVMGEDEVT
jgi:DNA-binding NarL/FixJ family response regulator